MGLEEVMLMEAIWLSLQVRQNKNHSLIVMLRVTFCLSYHSNELFLMMILFAAFIRMISLFHF